MNRLKQARKPGSPAPITRYRWACVLMAVAGLAAASAASTFGATKAGAPVNTCPPTLDGSFVVGKEVTATNGCWSNNPTSYAYKWSRCNNQTATACGLIAGAKEQSYTPTQADIGHSLVVLVSASNSAGTAGPATSKPSELVSAAAAPVFKTRPVINGDAQVGEPL